MNDILGIAIFVWAMLGIGCFIASALLLAYAKRINTKTKENIKRVDELLARSAENYRMAQESMYGTYTSARDTRIYQ